jgi:hypothetical protein
MTDFCCVQRWPVPKCDCVGMEAIAGREERAESRGGENGYKGGRNGWMIAGGEVWVRRVVNKEGGVFWRVVMCMNPATEPSN